MKKVDIILIGLATLGIERIVERVYEDMRYSIKSRNYRRRYIPYYPYYNGGYRDYSRYNSATERDESNS